VPLAAVLFDLDGTLVDSRADIAAAANHALARHDFPTLSVETISGYVGDGAQLLLARASGLAVTDPRIPELYSSFVEFYGAHPADKTRLCTGAAEALDGRLGLVLGLCTNKPRTTTLRVLDALGISRHFEVIVAGGDARAKPDPEPVLLAARALGVRPGDVVMVGDGAQDVLSGRGAGARTVGVRGGIQPEETLLRAEPDAMLESLLELPALLDAWRSPSDD